MAIAAVITYISIVSGLLPLLACIANYSNLDIPLKILALYFFISVVSDIVLIAVPQMGMKNNAPIIHLYIIITMVLIGAVYYRTFYQSLLKYIALVICVATIGVSIYFARDIWAYPAESNTASSIAFIILSLMYFYQILNRQEFVHIEKQGMFWINAAILFYYAIDIFPFMLFKEIAKEHQGEFYTIHNIANILTNILFSVGVLCKPQKAIIA